MGCRDMKKKEAPAPFPHGVVDTTASPLPLPSTRACQRDSTLPEHPAAGFRDMHGASVRCGALAGREYATRIRGWMRLVRSVSAAVGRGYRAVLRWSRM